MNTQSSAVAAPMPFPSVLETLDALGVTFRRDGGNIALKNADALSFEILEAVREHKPALLGVCETRGRAEELHTRVIFLRCHERTARADRPTLTAFLGRRIESLSARCDVFDEHGGPTGWLDSDPFASDGYTALVLEFEELTARGNPYPLGPLADDPFSMNPPRLYNGKPV